MSRKTPAEANSDWQWLLAVSFLKYFLKSERAIARSFFITKILIFDEFYAFANLKDIFNKLKKILARFAFKIFYN